MKVNQPGSIKTHFSKIADPRDLYKRHKLLDIITIAICAVVCGANSWEHIEVFGHSKLDWFNEFLKLATVFPPTMRWALAFNLILLAVVC
jgi:hypothetical protein